MLNMLGQNQIQKKTNFILIIQKTIPKIINTKLQRGVIVK